MHTKSKLNCFNTLSCACLQRTLLYFVSLEKNLSTIVNNHNFNITTKVKSEINLYSYVSLDFESYFKIILLIIYFLKVNCTHAQNNSKVQEKTRMGYEMVYAYKLRSADSLLAENKKWFKSNYLNHLLAASIGWCKVQSGKVDKNFCNNFS